MRHLQSNVYFYFYFFYFLSTGWQFNRLFLEWKMPRKLEWKLERDHFLKGHMYELQLIPIFGAFFVPIESGLVIKNERISFQFSFQNSFQFSFQFSGHFLFQKKSIELPPWSLRWFAIQSRVWLQRALRGSFFASPPFHLPHFRSLFRTVCCLLQSPQTFYANICQKWREI